MGRGANGRLTDTRFLVATVVIVVPRWRVTLSEDESAPFKCELNDAASRRRQHGTTITTVATRNLVSVSRLRKFIGSRFLVDPSFQITINGEKLELVDFRSKKTINARLDGHAIRIHEMDSSSHDRNTMLHGITWWVGERMVGLPSWEGLDERGAILDGRSNQAKRFSFVVEADLLRDDVRSDWTGFEDSERSRRVKELVHEKVIIRLNASMRKADRSRKRLALEENRTHLHALTRTRRARVGRFVERLLINCPSLGDGDLARTVEVLATMEESESGYDLLKRLSMCSPNDLDTWQKLMNEWTASNAQIVLDLLGRRSTRSRESDHSPECIDAEGRPQQKAVGT